MIIQRISREAWLKAWVTFNSYLLECAVSHLPSRYLSYWSFHPCVDPDLPKAPRKSHSLTVLLVLAVTDKKRAGEAQDTRWVQLRAGGGGLQVMDTTAYSRHSLALILRYWLDYVAVSTTQRNTSTALLHVNSRLKLQVPVKCLCYL